MKRMKAIIVVVTILVLCVICIVLFRFIQNIIISAASGLQRAGEEPIVETLDEGEIWTVPTMPVDSFDFEQGIDRVTGETSGDDASAASALPAEDEDELTSVPVDETADELADTALGDIPDETPPAEPAA